MPANKQDLSQWKNTSLMFKGIEHNLQSVLTTAASGPMITVKLNEITPLDSDIPDNKVLIDPNNDAIHEANLVFFKHQGSYLVLAGRNLILRAKDKKQTEISGRLLSSPALKKTRINQPVAEPVTEVRATPPTAPYRGNTAFSRSPPPKSNSRYG
jgi:hypothetical protein